MKKLLAIVCITALSHMSYGNDATPDIVGNGITALTKEGPAAALSVWLKGSPIENDTTGRSKILGALSSVQDIYGKPIGFEIIQSVQITPSLTRVYGIITYQKGALYSRWDCYKSAEGWIIPEFFVNTTAEHVLPAKLLSK